MEEGIRRILNAMEGHKASRSRRGTNERICAEPSTFPRDCCATSATHYLIFGGCAVPIPVLRRSTFSESDLLDDLVEAYKGSRAADSGGAVDDDRPHVGGDALAVRPHEPDQGLRRLRNT